ncbi:MAG: helix-turn-helix domain-containing protein [Bacteroidales bacterium]|nr:helix-turn-helix domain-containing protein [Bacteroidales bacterium]
MRNLLGKIILTISFSLLWFASAAENDKHYVKHLGVRDGLSRSHVTTTLVDHNGRLWVGTPSGLNRFDGSRFSVYDGNSLDGSIIYSLFEDQDGRLWAGTDCGLSQYDAWSNSFKTVYEGKVFCISSFKERLLVATDSALLIQEADGFRELPLPGNGIVSMVNIEECVYLIGRWELMKFDGDTITEISIPDFSGTIISAAWHDGALWLGVYQKGIIVVNLEGKILRHYPDGTDGIRIGVVCAMMSEPEKDRLWLGTDGDGVCLLDFSGIRRLSSVEGFSDTSDIPNTIVSLGTDSFHNIWVGSSIDGVYCLKPSCINFYREGPDALSYRAITSIYADGPSVWIGTDGGGIVQFRTGDSTFRRFPSTAGKKITSICPLDYAHLLVSIYCEGVFLFEKTSGNIKKYELWDDETSDRELQSGNIITLYPTPDGKILILAEGSYVYDPRSRVCSELSSSIKPPPSKLSFWMDGLACACSGKSLVSINSSSGEILPLFTMEDNTIIYNAALYDGEIWLATGRGLFCYNTESGEARKVQTNLFQHPSFLMADTVGHLWISADGMLFCYDGDSYKAFDESSGFANNEILCGIPLGDIVYMGGSLGFAQINLSGQSLPDIQMQMIPEKVIVDGHHLQERNGVYKYSGSVAEIRISYSLVGADPFQTRFFKFTVSRGAGKFETSSPELVISSPSPGRYTINASFLRNDGLWESSSVPITLLLSKPLTSSWWFWIAVCLLIAAIVFWMRYRIKKNSKTILLRPNIPIIDSSIDLTNEAFIRKFDTLLEENISNEDLDVNLMVNGMAMSRTTLYDKVKAITGLAIGEYILKVRIDMAKRYLSETAMPISEISDNLGFSSQRYFSTAFKRATGSSPSDFRKANQGYC